MRILLALCIALALAVSPHATSAAELDGVMWKSWSTSTKKVFIAGFMSAADYIGARQVPHYLGDSKSIAIARYSDYADLAHNRRDRYSSTEVASLLNFVRHEQFNDLKRFKLSSLTMDELISGIDRFYGEYRNSAIKITDSFYFVKRKLEGTTDEELQAVLQHLRNPDTRSTEIVFTDHRGEIGVATFP